MHIRGVERIGKCAAPGPHLEIGEFYLQCNRPCLEPELAQFPADFLGLRQEHFLKIGNTVDILWKSLFGADRFRFAVGFDRRIIYPLRLLIEGGSPFAEFPGP